VEQTVRLIRSKGVGVFFVTQSPKDIPPDVLGQLGQRVQHALRAFTPDDEKALRAAARTFPKTRFYDVEETLTTLGIGEALVTVLGESGAPTPPFVCRVVPPSSRMGPLTDAELGAELARSPQVAEYARAVDRESAREMLAERAARDEGARGDAQEAATQRDRAAGHQDDYRQAPPPPRPPKEAPSTFEQVLNSRTTQNVLRTAVGAITRGLMGALVGSPRRSSTRRRSY
jgi:hypothetical protein